MYISGNGETKKDAFTEVKTGTSNCLSRNSPLEDSIIVNVRWFDGYLEVFRCSQVRQGGEIIWMRLTNGQNRTIPLTRVRWFSTDPESHSGMEAM